MSAGLSEKLSRRRCLQCLQSVYSVYSDRNMDPSELCCVICCPDCRRSTERSSASGRFSRMVRTAHLVPPPRLPREFRNTIQPEVAFIVVCLWAIISNRRSA